MGSREKRKEAVGSGDEVPLFPEGWTPQAMSDPDDGVAPVREGCERKARRKGRGKRREECVPETTRLDRALETMRAGAAGANRFRLSPEASMDDELTSLITYAKTHPHASSIELQGTPLVILQWNASAAEGARQVAAQAAYPVSWIDWNRPGRL